MGVAQAEILQDILRAFILRYVRHSETSQFSSHRRNDATMNVHGCVYTHTHIYSDDEGSQMSKSYVGTIRIYCVVCKHTYGVDFVLLFYDER